MSSETAHEPQSCGPPGPRALIIAIALITALELAGMVLSWRQAAPRADEPLFAYIALNWREGGGDFLPYRDAFENKPPGIFLLYRTLLGTGAGMFRPVQIAAGASLVLTSVLLGILARAIGGTAAGALGGLLALTMLLRSTFEGGVADTETFMLPLVTGGLILALLSGRKHSGWLAGIAGLLIGLGFLFKPVAVVELVCAIVLLLGMGQGTRLAPLGLGFLLPLAASAVWAAARGILPHYIECAFLALFTDSTHAQGFAQAGRRVLSNATLLGPERAGLLVGVLVAWQALRRGAPPTAAADRMMRWWVVLTVVVACSTGFLFPHQFKPAVVACTLMIAVAATRAWPHSSAAAKRTVVNVGLALAVLMAIATISKVRGTVANLDTPWTGRYDGIVKEIKTRTSPGAGIWVACGLDCVYLLSGRRSPARVFNPGPAPGHAEELLAQLRASPPALIITHSSMYLPGTRRTAPILSGLLATSYSAPEQVSPDGWIVYRLNAHSSAGSPRRKTEAP